MVTTAGPAVENKVASGGVSVEYDTEATVFVWKDVGASCGARINVGWLGAAKATVGDDSVPSRMLSCTGLTDVLFPLGTEALV